jgi:hypothetical protein
MLTIKIRSDGHEVSETLHRCEDLISAIYGWTSVYSHLMRQKIQQLRWDSLRMAPTSAETRSYNRPNLLVGEHKLHLGNIMCGVTLTTCLLPLFISFMRALSTKTTSTVYGTADKCLYNIFVSSSVCLVTRAYEGLQKTVSLNPAWTSFTTTSLAKP